MTVEFRLLNCGFGAGCSAPARAYSRSLAFSSVVAPHLQLDGGVGVVFEHEPSFLCASGDFSTVTVEPGGEHGGLLGVRLITQ